MDGKVTIKDIASRTGVSIASVHRALHGRSGVSDHLRRQILHEVERSGYTVDESAAWLRRGLVRIAILLPKPENNGRFFYRGLWHGIMNGARKLENHKAEIRMIDTDCNVRELSTALEKLYDETDGEPQALDGLVTMCDDENTASWIRRFIRRGTKVALVDRSMPIEGLTCSCEASVDDIGALAAELAWLYFSTKSGGRILVVNGSPDRSSYRRYEAAVRDRIGRLSGCEDGSLMDFLQVLSGEDEEQVRFGLKNLFRSSPPDVIISASSRTTFWVCDETAAFFGSNMAACPAVVGMDVFPEQRPFFENGILKAVIYQSHLTCGEQCLEYLTRSLVDMTVTNGKQFIQPLSVVMRENYRYFIPDEEIGKKQIYEDK